MEFITWLLHHFHLLIILLFFHEPLPCLDLLLRVTRGLSWSSALWGGFFFRGFFFIEKWKKIFIHFHLFYFMQKFSLCFSSKCLQIKWNMTNQEKFCVGGGGGGGEKVEIWAWFIVNFLKISEHFQFSHGMLKNFAIKIDKTKKKKKIQRGESAKKELREILIV